MIGPCDCAVLCDPLGADRYMLRGGSAWTGLRLASSGMPGWKKGALLLQRMVERSTVRLRQLACNRAEEVKLGRFVRNDRVSLAALNRGAGERVLPAAELVTVVSDREADIYQSWARSRPANLHLLVRAAQNRSVVAGHSLFAACDRLAVAFCYELEVPRQPGRPARRARMEVRFGKVELLRPRWQRRSPGLRGATPDSVVVHVVDVRECGARARTGPPPLHWRLLPTHAVETPPDPF